MNRAWLSILGLALLALPSRAREPSELVIALQAGERWEVNLDQRGRPLAGHEMLVKASSVLETLVGRSYRRSETWKALLHLAAPDFYREVERVAGLSDFRRVYLFLLPIDGQRNGRYRVLPGDRIQVPGWSLPYLVRGERTLDVVSRLTGVGLEPLVAMNRRRFSVSPHTSFEFVHRRGHLRSRPGGRPGHRSRVVRLGESHIGKYRSLPELLLHEAAHLGQDGSFEHFSPYYGPDGIHHPDEVIPWTAAYVEGWARYQSTHLPRRLARNDPVLPDLLAPVSELWRETDEGGRYLRLSHSQRRVEHYLGNEHAVGRLLLAFEATAGREAVEAAFQRTKKRPTPTLAALVGALRESRPELSGELRRILERETQGAEGAELLDGILRGEVPRGLDDPEHIPVMPPLRRRLAD